MMSNFIDSTITKRPNGTWEYINDVYEFSLEEIEEANQKEKIMNDAGVEKALADGLIRIPISFYDVEDNLVEMNAWVHPSFTPSNTPNFREKHGMDYNIYVPSYGRAGRAPTIDMLKRFGVENWYLAIDPSQYEEYKNEYGKEHLILRDIRFRDPSMVDLGTSVKRPNSMNGTAGIYNNLLSFSRSLGERKYWTMDDDILGLAMKAYKGRWIDGEFHSNVNVSPNEKYDKDNYYRCSNIKEEYGFNFQEFMRRIERVGNATRNHGFLGLEKFGTVFSLCVQWKTGTRVYSFYLSDNATQPRHIGAMNNDVATSLEQSKRGMPPGLLEVISYNSMATQGGNGGLSDQYSMFGTLEKGKILVNLQPNFVKITERYNRIHHTGDFNTYNKQKFKGAPVDPNNPL